MLFSARLIIAEAVAPDIGTMNTVNRQKWVQAALMFIMLMTTILRLWHLVDYPLHEDELASKAALESIVATGLPLIQGEIYWRSLVGHYLMAVPLLFMEPSLHTARLVPILCSAFVLLYSYRIARALSGALVGLLVACALGFSAYESLFAAFARFYLPFQLFFVASIWFAYRYSVIKERSAGKWLFLFSLAAVGTHRFGLLVWPLLVLALLCGQDWSAMRSLKTWAGLLVLGAFTYFTCFWVPPNVHQNVVALDLYAGNLRDKLVFVRFFRDWAPLCLTFIAAGVVPACKCRGGWLFFYLVFLMGAVSISMLAPADNPRYILHLFPLGVALAVASAGWWLKYLCNVLRDIKINTMRSGRMVVVVAALLFLTTSAWYDNKDLGKAFGYHLTFMNQKPAHDFLARQMLASDVLLSVDSSVSRYYLESADVRFLREKLDMKTGLYRPYSGKENGRGKNSYVDSPKKIQHLLDSRGRNVWLYANNKIKWSISPETDRLIREQFDLVYKYEDTWVLVHRPHRKTR